MLIYYLGTEAVCLRVSGWGASHEWVPCLKSEWVGCASNPYVHWYHIESNPEQCAGESLWARQRVWPACSTSSHVPFQFWTLIEPARVRALLIWPPGWQSWPGQPGLCRKGGFLRKGSCGSLFLFSLSSWPSPRMLHCTMHVWTYIQVYVCTVGLYQAAVSGHGSPNLWSITQS